MNAAERQLAALAFALLPKSATISAQERRCVDRAFKPTRKQLADAKKAVLAGGDPLGDELIAARSAEQRRFKGATYTPAVIVRAMLDWAANHPTHPARIVDPGSGSGRFLMEAAARFPKAQLVAIDVDPLATLILRANATIRGFASRLDVKLGDYRRMALDAIDRPTLFIGNPPYVRHHDIAPAWKDWFAETAASFGFTASKLAGLHIHFFLRTRQLARDGDFGAFITAAEWLDVNYGSVLRAMLADGLGGAALHLIDPKAQPFADALTTGAITCFHVGHRPDELTIRSVDSLDQLAPLSDGRLVAWDEVAAARKWSIFTRVQPKVPAGYIELGEVFRVHRGQVTGGNAVWIAGPHATGLPSRCLLPAVTKARELFAAGDVLSRAHNLRRVIDLPVDLSELTKTERIAVECFLAWAKRAGADQSYVALHRRAWWSVGYKEPAAILCTYMARRPPHFVRNAARVRHINIAHGLYPREPIIATVLDRVARILRGLATLEGGRVYAGGLVKFEPKELERMPIPRLDLMHDIAAEMDEAAASGRRRNRYAPVSA